MNQKPDWIRIRIKIKKPELEREEKEAELVREKEEAKDDNGKRLNFDKIRSGGTMNF